MKAGAEGHRGAVAILAAFLLLTLMAAAAFATGRNLKRELSICGAELSGARAADAAEAGLAWFLAQPPMEAAAPRTAPAGLLDEGPDGAFQVGFDLRIRCLGLLPRRAEDPGAPAERLWQVTSTGRCAPKALDGEAFIQVRELLVADARAPDRPDALRILAWRAVTPTL